MRANLTFSDQTVSITYSRIYLKPMRPLQVPGPMGVQVWQQLQPLQCLVLTAESAAVLIKAGRISGALVQLESGQTILARHPALTAEGHLVLG